MSHLAGDGDRMGGASTADAPVARFLSALASRSATPGGGSASALVGAIAAGLAGMVGRLNERKDGAAGPLHDSIAAADALRKRLTALIDEDMAAFEGLAASWKLPAGDAHAAQKQAAVVRATRTPLEIMERCLEVMRLAGEGLEKSKRNCLSDAGVAAVVAHAALEGARLNVSINLPGIEDPAVREELLAAAERIRAVARSLREAADRKIEAEYRG